MAEYRVQLLAPNKQETPTVVHEGKYNHYLDSLQRLRARIYLEDGAIQPHQIQDHKFTMEMDLESWHFLLVDSCEDVVACLRILLHPATATFDRLRLQHCPLATDPYWGTKLRGAVEEDLVQTRSEQIGYAELGGWAIAPKYRCTKAALEILVSSYVWGEMIGGCVSSCTATVRHKSSTILRKIGGKNYSYQGEDIPAYHDPQYGCLMEILRFDSRCINPKFIQIVQEMRSKVENSTIFCAAIDCKSS